MVREYVAGLVVVVAASPLAGCSLALDFSDEAIPVDAAPDAPYTQAQCEALEPNDSVAAAALVTPGDLGMAAICAAAPEDHDFYRFTVPAGTASVAISLTFTSSPAGDIDLKLLDATGTLIAQSRGFVDNEAIVCPGASPVCPTLAEGDYVFEVLPALPGAVNAYGMALTITPM